MIFRPESSHSICGFSSLGTPRRLWRVILSLNTVNTIRKPSAPTLITITTKATGSEKTSALEKEKEQN